ncbi:hypothetical protein KQI84_00160 [bacterium]|nr:hypothetical protein [bacterium]
MHRRLAGGAFLVLLMLAFSSCSPDYKHVRANFFSYMRYSPDDPETILVYGAESDEIWEMDRELNVVAKYPQGSAICMGSDHIYSFLGRDQETQLVRIEETSRQTGESTTWQQKFGDGPADACDCSALVIASEKTPLVRVLAGEKFQDSWEFNLQSPATFYQIGVSRNGECAFVANRISRITTVASRRDGKIQVARLQPLTKGDYTASDMAPSGDQFALGDFGKVHLCATDPPALLKEIELRGHKEVRCLMYSRDGRYLVATDKKSVHLIDVQSGEVLCRYTARSVDQAGMAVRGILLGDRIIVSFTTSQICSIDVGGKM